MLDGESFNASFQIMGCQEHDPLQKSLAVEREGFKDQKPFLQCHSSHSRGLEKRLVALPRTSSIYRFDVDRTTTLRLKQQSISPKTNKV